MKCVTVDVLLRRFFYAYGFYLNRYRWFFLIVPVILSAICSSGFYFLKEQTVKDSYYIFTPLRSISGYEKAVLDDHWPLSTNKYYPGKFYAMKYRVEILVQAKDGGNLLREEYLNATVEVNNIVSDTFSVLSHDGSLNISYPLICLSWEGDCFKNGHLELLQNVQRLADYSISVTYPITRKNDAPFYIGSGLGGVQSAYSNGSFDFVRTLRMTYAMIEAPSPFDLYSRQWMLALQDLINSYESDYLTFAINHAESLDQGLEENAIRLIPRFAVTFMILTVFCTMCSFVLLHDKKGASSKKENEGGIGGTLRGLMVSVDWVRSKPGLALVGVLSSCMAISTSMGIMLFAGWNFNAVTFVMPFLVLSIGVNDMCLMSTAWHRTSMSAPVEVRLSEMLSEAAVAISITSFTDVIAFAIGSWNSLPAVILFCTYTSVALLMEYIFQITFFAAAFAFYGHAESQGRHCLAPCSKAVPSNRQGLNWFQKTFQRGTVPSSIPSQTRQRIKNVYRPTFQQAVEMETPIMRFFRLRYAPAILHPIGRVLVALCYFTYIGLAFWGCTRIKEGLQFTDLIYRQHYMVHYVDMIPDFWHEGMQAQIVVNNPPNLASEYERQKLLAMVRRFENTTHTMQRNATMFFLDEYMNYLDEMNADLKPSELWTDKLKSWIKNTGASVSWETDTQWDPNNDTNLLAFRFQIGLRNFATGDDHRATATFLRGLAREYDEYNITTYHEYWPFVDQYIMIRPTMVIDNVTGVIAMIIIALILIPNLVCGIFITLSMLSINIGVYGYMTWWGVHLDCVSMITCIMALGFAVDYSSHICYAYVSAQGMPTTKRTVAALETLGWPVFQGALSTILGTLVLASVDGYLVQTFFKTVFLTILFGLLHSAVFLPVTLSLLLPENGIPIRELSKKLLDKINVRNRSDVSNDKSKSSDPPT